LSCYLNYREYLLKRKTILSSFLFVAAFAFAAPQPINPSANGIASPARRSSLHEVRLGNPPAPLTRGHFCSSKNNENSADGTFVMLYRAQDASGTSRLGYAESTDGIHFTRRPSPSSPRKRLRKRRGCRGPTPRAHQRHLLPHLHRVQQKRCTALPRDLRRPGSLGRQGSSSLLQRQVERRLDQVRAIVPKKSTAIIDVLAWHSRGQDRPDGLSYSTICFTGPKPPTLRFFRAVRESLTRAS